jgi:hypothetical protein
MSAAIRSAAIVAVPSLDEVACNPLLVERLDVNAVKALMLRLTVAQSALATRLVADEPAQTSTMPEDEMLSPEQAAVMLKQTRRWLSRNSHRLPFVKRISQRSFLCSKQGIAKWLATRKG